MKTVADLVHELERAELTMSLVIDKVRVDYPDWLICKHFHCASVSAWKSDQYHTGAAMFKLNGHIEKLGAYSYEEISSIILAIRSSEVKNV